jgi:hypothetical protein
MRRVFTLALAAGLPLIGAGIFGLTTPAAHADAVPGPTLSVDLTADKHRISPDIYGMNFADEALAKELDLPVRRWGGNATTRYNYALDETNRAADWYFENAPGNADPATLPDGSETDTFVDQDRRTGTSSLLTVPLIGWIPKARDTSCGFSVTKYGAQQSTDQWRPDCGNGIKPDGTPITGNDPLDTSKPAGADYVKAWLNHLTAKYGTAANGGVKYYNLDNEPDIWFQTHRDVHPNGATYEEMRDQTYAIAGAVKAVDPGAQTLGPTGWGWLSLTHSGSDQQACGRPTAPPNCWDSPPEYTAHGNTPFGAWYLQQMRAYERSHGTRILDYYDNHWYPQETNVGIGSDGTDPTTNALRLRSTRNLWDPTYTDESWINQPTQVIPRMKSLVAANYPGTKTAITEYNWGALGDINGALAQADVLGIFGREGLDLATLWAPPTASQPGAFAFRMFRNFDGRGSQFGDTAVKATSTDQDQLSVYASTRPDGTVTLVIINKTGQEVTSPVNFTAKLPGTTAQLYQYSAADTSKIVALPSRQVMPAPVCATCPPLATMAGSYAANSITTVVIGSSGPSPSASASNSPSPPAGASCTATYQITNQWPGGFQGDVTVRATGRAAVRGWTVNWTFANGQKVTQNWNATVTQAGTVVTAKNVVWNATIAPGDSTSFGFLGSWNGSNPIPTTVSCSAT